MGSSSRGRIWISNLICVIVGLLLADPVASETVYVWRDAKGVTHFSEECPENPPADIQTIELDAPRPAANSFDNYYSVINQARRMGEERRKREQDALERRLAILEAQRGSDSQYDENHTYDETYVPVYPYYGYSPGKGGYGHRPDGRRSSRYWRYFGQPERGYRSGYGHFSGKPAQPGKPPGGRARSAPRGIVNLGR
jgi:hypothetical protein